MIEKRIKAISTANMTAVRETTLPTAPNLQQTFSELEQYVKLHAPEISFAYAGDRIVFLKLEDGKLYVAVRLYYRFDKVETDEANHNHDVIYVLGQDENKEWKFYTSYSTSKTFYR